MIELVFDQIHLWDLNLIWNWVIPLCGSFFGCVIFIINVGSAKKWPSIATNFEKRLDEKPYTNFLLFTLSPLLFYIFLPAWHLVVLTVMGYALIHCISEVNKEWT